MKRMLILWLLIVTGGCTSMSGMEEERDSSEGTTETYAITKGKALEVAKVVLKEQGADDFKESQDYVIGSFYVNLISPGSFCGVYPVEKDGKCQVRVISRRKSSVSFFTGLTETGFHEAFAAKLGREMSK